MMTSSETANKQRRYLKIAAILLLSIAIVLCIALLFAWYSFKPNFKAAQDAYLYGHDNYKLPLSDVQKYSAAKRFSPYALMSAHAYCIRESDKGEATALSENRDKIRKALGEWELYEGVSNPGDDCPSGFYSEVWKQNKGKETLKMVVVFRGTSGLCDWVTNLVQPTESKITNSIGRFVAKSYDWIAGGYLSGKSQANDSSPQESMARLRKSDSCVEHYRKAAEKIEAVVEEFERQGWELEKLEIYTTGHSLGGGLAEHALYSNPDIVEQAIGFNPSPVTGYSKVGPDKQRAAYCCGLQWGSEAIPTEPRVYRLFESGEVLAVLRGLKIVLSKLAAIVGQSSVFGASDAPFIHEVQFNYKQLSESGPLSAHGIETLANSMQSDSAKAPDGMAYWYQGEGSEAFRRIHESYCKSSDKNGACKIPDR